MFDKLKDFISGKQSAITEKLLFDNNITIIKKNDLQIDKSAEIASMTNGKFYVGKYKQAKCSVKIINKQTSNDEQILNEIIFWNSMYSKDKILLELIGINLTNQSVNLVFETFQYTFDKALQMNILKDDNRVKILRQLFNILEKIVKSNKIFTGLRPGVFGIKQGLNIVLIDYGGILNSIDENEKYYLKYYPPERVNFLESDIKSDIWSFGCILIDLFSVKQPIYKQNISSEEIYRLHEYPNSYPQVPSDITGMLKDIILSCVESNLTQRIGIDLLSLQINEYLKISSTLLSLEPAYFDKLNKFEKSEDISEISNLKNGKDYLIKDYYTFVKEKEKSLNTASNCIMGEMMTSTVNYKEEIGDSLNHSLQTLNDKTSFINKEINAFCINNISVIRIIKEKVIERIIEIQQTLATAGSDIFETQGTLNELKVNVLSIANLPDYHKYKNLVSSVENLRKNIVDHFKKYSDQKDYDKLLSLSDEIRELTLSFKSLVFNDAIMLNYIIEAIEKSKKEIASDPELLNLSKKLQVEGKIQKHIHILDKSAKPKFLNYLARIQPDSNLITIFDYENKLFSHLRLNQINSNISDFKLMIKSNNSLDKFYQFPKKVVSCFRNKDKKLYLPGGIIEKSEIKECFKIEIKYKDNPEYSYDEERFYFEISSIKEMITARSSYGTIWDSEENYLFVIGGSSTKKCEVYDVEKNNWNNLPELANLAPNCSLGIINDFIFCFNAGAEYNSLEGIYMLSLKNFMKTYIFKNKGFYENGWEEIDYTYNFEGRIKKSMGIINTENKLLLLGGFDHDRNFYDVMEFEIKIEKIEVQDEEKFDNDFELIEKKNNKKKEVKCVDCIYYKINSVPVSLPVGTFFNNCQVAMKTNTDVFNLLCGNSNAFELNAKFKEFFYFT